MANKQITLNLSGNTTVTQIRRFFNSMVNYVKGTTIDFKYEIARQSFNEAVKNTPVKTGWARGSWSAGIGSATPKAIPRPGKGTRLSPPEFNTKKATDPSSEYQITNDAPHIVRLDAGWSKQAPSGFIEASVDAGIRQAIALMRRKV
jgi:hypothetical protein